LNRELGGEPGTKRERIIGRRLREGYIHYRRYLEILNIISKYGFGYLFDRVRSVNIIPKLEGTKEKIKHKPAGVRLRLMFEELGPTFIKIGQMLTTQPNLVPEEYIAELESLKDDVAPIPYEDVKTAVEKELGKKINDSFIKFDKTPVGSASIGQVHRALTKAKKKVAVKIQRPKVKDKIMADMKILEDLADMFSDILDISEVIDPIDMVREFKRLLSRELDYTIEARSIEHFRDDFSGVDEVVIPRVYWDLTTQRVLTMDFIEGIPVDEVKKLKSAGLDPKVVALNLGQAVARMIFVKGYFHGDPHGGNVMVQSGCKIALLDFGSIGFLDEKMRNKIRLFYLFIAKEHVSRATEIFLDICQVSESKINRPALEQDLKEFLDYQRLLRKGHQIKDGMNQRIVSVALKHGFAPPPPFILLERALLEVEGVARKLSPKFDLNEMLRPILGDMLKEKLTTEMDPLGAIQTAQEYKELMRKGPKKVLSILDKLDSGDLVVKMDSTLVDDIRQDMWRIVLIMGVTIIAMALLLMVAVAGITIKTPVFGMSVTAIPILILWLVAIWWIYRRWRGPR
jgi:ubiquinone biosynthesis protein